MSMEQHTEVAVLLATYNAAQFVDAQIKSLTDNRMPFTLHWLDDHSSDNTREIVRSSARNSGITLTEWHQPRHVGLPGSFFRLLECVEADIYLFCDQDDIWQPGKIDATVSNLAIDIASPVLCFSDTLLFGDGRPKPSRSLFEMIGKERVFKALRGEPMFEMFSRAIAPGHTQGFTRPVREMFLKHKNIAYAYAFMHDWWIHDITIAAGTVRTFSVVPTVLWRQHGDSFRGNIGGTARGIVKKWQVTQLWRRVMARHARGFVLSAPTLPSGTNKARLIELAQLIGTIDQRQTLVTLLRLARRGVISQSLSSAVWFSIACLCSDAAPIDGRHRLLSMSGNDIND